MYFAGLLGGAKSVESCGEHDKKCGLRTGHQQNVHCGMDRIGYIVRCIHIANPRINLVDPSPGPFQTMAVKDGSGPRPAAHTAKRCFLNWLESSFRPSICLPSCTASCQLACLFLQLAFFLRRSGEGTVFLASNLLASSCSWLRSRLAGPKHHGSDTAERCFLNCPEISSKPSICLPSCTASCQLACLFLQLAFFLRRSG